MIKKTVTYFLLLLVLLLALWACNIAGTEKSGVELVNEDANGFAIYKTENGYNLYVKDPFQGSEGNTYSYKLRRTKQKGAINIPVKKVVCLSTSHIAYIDALNKNESIVGISGSGLVFNETLSEKIKNNSVIDVGYGEYLNAEVLISLNPDIVFAYGIDRQSLLPLEKLNAAGIPVVLVGDYLENTALGRLEWIRFFACFFDMLNYSETLYDSVSNNYQSLTKIALECKDKPSVLVGLPWQGTWFVPGGDSFLSNMINDAGGNYIFKENESHESIPMSIEQVFNSANSIDVWIHLNSYNSKKQILDTDNRFEVFKPLHNALVYNNNKKINNEGGNDYWESGVMHPDIVLKDLISIFHPKLFPDYEMVYYSQINE